MNKDKPIGEMNKSEFEEIGFIFDNDSFEYYLYLDNIANDAYGYYISIEFIDKVWFYGCNNSATKPSGVLLHGVNTKTQLAELAEILRGKNITSESDGANQMSFSGLKKVGFPEIAYLAYKRYSLIGSLLELLDLGGSQVIDISPFLITLDEKTRFDVVKFEEVKKDLLK